MQSSGCVRSSVFLIETVRAFVAAQLVAGRFQLVEGVPVAGHEHQHGELAAERRHAALFDVAAAVEDDFRQIVDYAGAIRTNS